MQKKTLDKQSQQTPTWKTSQTGYTVLAHQKKIPALLNVYDALQMSQEFKFDKDTL